MKTIYTLTVRSSVKIPAGTLNLDVGCERTFLFASVKERQPVLDFVKAQGWKHSTSIDHLMTAEEARREIKASITAACDHLHHPVPSFVEPGK